MNIQPSSALIVRADDTILSSIELMQKHNVGSILVVNDRAEAVLVGIFTERDLLKRIHLIADGSHWSRPIRTIMTSPVRTLNVEEIDKASDLMLEFGIRHLPVVTVTKDERTIVVGVLSMRDLFRRAVRGELPKRKRGKKSPPSIGVITNDSYLLLFLKNTLTALMRVDITRIGAWKELPKGTSLKELEALDALFLDLDEWPTERWSEFLRFVLRLPRPQVILLLFDPIRYKEEELNVIQQLSKTNRFASFAKPINPFLILDHVQSALERS